MTVPGRVSISRVHSFEIHRTRVKYCVPLWFAFTHGVFSFEAREKEKNKPDGGSIKMDEICGVGAGKQRKERRKEKKGMGGIG